MTSDGGNWRREHLEATERCPILDVFYPLGASAAPRAALLVFPGGGYRRVATEKEGATLARTLLAHRHHDLVIFICTYRVGGTYLRPTSHPIEPAIADAHAALAFVRSVAGGAAAGQRFGPIDASRIGVCGFSAGGNLALCLVHRERAEAGSTGGRAPIVGTSEAVEAPTLATAVARTVAESALAAAASSLAQLAESTDNAAVQATQASGGAAPPRRRGGAPPIAALLLFYPTLRSPSCACIAGGVFVPSSLGAWSGGSYGESWPLDASNGQHQYCWASATALRRLQSALPAPLCVVTARGDMLLPTGKHGGRLVAAVAAHRRVCALIDNGDVGGGAGEGSGGAASATAQRSHRRRSGSGSAASGAAQRAELPPFDSAQRGAAPQGALPLDPRLRHVRGGKLLNHGWVGRDGSTFWVQPVVRWCDGWALVAPAKL